MTLTLGSRFEDALAAPTESQAANPLEGATSRWIHSAEVAVESVELKPSSRALPKRTVPEPKQKQKLEFERAERHAVVDQARRLTEVAPDSPTAFGRYAEALALAGMEKLALSAARKTISLAQSTQPAINGEVVEQAPPDRAAALFVAARIVAASGMEIEAEAILSALPGAGPWRGLYASLAADRADYVAALERLGDQTDAATESLRGYVLLELNRPEGALGSLRAAMRKGEDTPALWSNLAFAYAALGSPRKALRAAGRAVQLAPSDRQVSFNLANYLRGSGHHEAALAELKRLATIRGEGDPVIAAALAYAHVACGQIAEGLRVLRRAQHHHSLEAASPHLAELNANYALLQWRSGTITRSTVLKTLRDQIRTVGPTIGLVRMLADVGTRQADVLREVTDLRSQLAESTHARDLIDLDIRICILAGELIQATEMAVEHALSNPLDAEAMVHAVYLRANVLGEYSEAGSMGLRALRSTPADRMLVNNTAFALALGGRAQEAEELLLTIDVHNDPYLMATSGLVQFALKRIQAGLDYYDRAAALILRGGPTDESQDLLNVMRANEAIALAHLGLTREQAVPSLYEKVRVPKTWKSDSRFRLLELAARRTGIPWEVKNED